MAQILFAFIILASFIGFARAQNLDTPAMRTLSKVVIQKLQSQGIQTVGDLNLPELAQDFDLVQYKFVTRGFMSGQAGRTGSVNLRGQKIVYVNTLSLSNLNQEQTQLLMLHEALEAVGYDDEAYKLSSGLDVLTHTKDLTQLPSSFLENFKHTSKSNEVRTFQLKGGISGVGGGGDGVAIALKSLLTRMLMMERQSGIIDSNQAEEISKKLNLLSIETKTDFKNISDEDWLPNQTSNGYQIQAPLFMWNHSTKYQNAMIAKSIFEKMRQYAFGL